MTAAKLPLHEIEQVRFAELGDLLDGRYTNARPALMRAAWGGRPVAVVVAVNDPDEDGSVRVDPVALLLDEALLGQLDPGDDVNVVDREVSS